MAGWKKDGRWANNKMNGIVTFTTSKGEENNENGKTEREQIGLLHISAKTNIGSYF